MIKLNMRGNQRSISESSCSSSVVLSKSSPEFCKEVSALLHWVPTFWCSIVAINALIFWSFHPTWVFCSTSSSPHILCHSSCRSSSPQVPGAVLMSSGLSLGTTLAMISCSACLISMHSLHIVPRELADQFNFLWRLCWCFLRWRVLAHSSDRNPASVREGCSEEEDWEQFSLPWGKYLWKFDMYAGQTSAFHTMAWSLRLTEVQYWISSELNVPVVQLDPQQFPYMADSWPFCLPAIVSSIEGCTKFWLSVFKLI